MNPWITHQAATARLDDLYRAADVDRLARGVSSSRRSSRDHRAPARVAGELLVRAGRLLAGDR